MDKLITKIDNIFKEPEQYKKIVFVALKPIINEPVLFDFCNFNPGNDLVIINELNNNVIPLLNNYKRLISDTKQFNVNNHTWDYVTLLHKTRKIILNNSHIFKYSTTTPTGDVNTKDDNDNDDDDDKEEGNTLLSSSSLDFELSMILYMIASKEQSLVDDNKADNMGNKKNAIHLINAKICLEEAYLIAKDCYENLENITTSTTTNQDNEFISNKPYDILSYKKHINDIKTDHISNEDSGTYLIKSNTSSCSEWINDIGGLEIMKSRYQIAYCQANENFYKAIKYSSKDTLSKINVSFGISELYKEIISKNGTLGNEKYNDNNIKKFSKFMYYYWRYNAHKIAFKSSCKEYYSCDKEELLEYYEDPNQITLELNRFALLDKYYNKIIKVITDNKNLSWYKPIIDKKKESVEKIYNTLTDVLKKYGLSEPFVNIDNDLFQFDVLYCTTLSNKITFKSFIDTSLNRLQKTNTIKNFIDFCDNKCINIGIGIAGGGGGGGEDIIQLKDQFRKQLMKWEREHSTSKNDPMFMLGKIDSDLRWMIFFLSLFENDKSISDNKSYDILKTAINKFIVNFENK